MHEFWGRHTICNMAGMDAMYLSNVRKISLLLERAVSNGNATLVEVRVARFENGGLSIIAILCESHVALHIYPEYSSMFLDAFTCGHNADPQRIIQTLINELKPSAYDIQTIIRTSPALEE